MGPGFGAVGPVGGLTWRMSRAGLSCPGCGSSNIIDDDLYSQAQLVCTDCGSVVSEGALADDPVGGSGGTEEKQQGDLIKDWGSLPGHVSVKLAELLIHIQVYLKKIILIF